MDDCDVLVVGAGPAGSVSAALLAKRGYRVAIVDRSRFPRDKPCAEYLSPGVTELARRLEIDHIFRAAGPRSVRGMEIISPSGLSLRLPYRVGDRTLQASTLPRIDLDLQLLNHARALGASFTPGFTARAVVRESGTARGVEGTLAGKRLRMHARLTIVADGTRSALARSLGLAVRPRWPVRLGLVAHFDGEARLADDFGQMHVARGGYCGIAPLPDNRVNVAIVVRSGAVAASSRSATQYFEDWIAGANAVKRTLASCVRASTVRGVGPIGSRTRKAWAPGVLLVGDAAGFFDPFTGEGIYRALRGAELAGEVAHQALLCGDVSGRMLAAYDTLRVAAFRSKHVVTALVQLFVQYPWLMEYALPRLAARETPRRCLAAVLGDCIDAHAFLTPSMLWSALRP